ncbi:unnamed protein product [Eruca vesicaria subsp. sativa]|uniref:Uncharacterized protein n=1 Tax=Eruca vesicaria subsp. sativa TaxID=29727 RepID=A0ABC8J576_ERUVS|nr:unnamed protein product [Eruca vesicaria subsp. sativa]
MPLLLLCRITHAGPRKKIYFRQEQVKVVIISCGGLCPGFSDVTYIDHLTGNDDESKERYFTRRKVGKTRSMTENTGIRNANSTILMTSEDGFSYSSFKAVGYDYNTIHLSQLVTRVLSCYKPKK